MSLKIYNAYIYRGKNIHSLIGQLRRMKTNIHKEILDRLVDSVNPGTSVNQLATFIKSDMESHERTPFNVSCSTVIYPYKGELYVQFFGLDDLTIFANGNHFVSKKLFKDFHYQTSCDRPQGMSTAEWGHRRKVWFAIFEESGWNPAIAGLSYQFIGVDNVYTLAYAWEKRVKTPVLPPVR